MKTFEVIKTIRDDKTNHPIKTDIVGFVTAYTFTEAMRKATELYNNGKWLNISVSPKNLAQ